MVYLSNGNIHDEIEFSNTLQKYQVQLKLGFQRPKATANKTRKVWALEEWSFRGHVVIPEGVTSNPKKIKTFLKCLLPNLWGIFRIGKILPDSLIHVRNKILTICWKKFQIIPYEEFFSALRLWWHCIFLVGGLPYTNVKKMFFGKFF